MSADAVIKTFKEANAKTTESLKKDLARVRAGKATPSLIEGIKVSYYGQSSPLNQVGNISTPDARTIVIAPWDTSILGEIEKAINQSDVGLTPQNDGKVIRLSVPALTEERRKDLVKSVNKMAEDAKVAVRQNRQKANEGIKALEKSKALSEDDSKRQQEQVQKITDEATKAIDDVITKKTQEIMTI